MEPEHDLRPWGQVAVRNVDRSHPPGRLVVHKSSMLLNATRREGWYAAASTHPPAVGLAAAEPPCLRSALARREDGATHPPPGGKAGRCQAPSPPIPLMSMPRWSNMLIIVFFMLP